MKNDDAVKELIWVGDSRKQLRKFPKAVIRSMGYALHFAQNGETHPKAKLLKGFKPMVWEIVDDFDTDTFRAIYTVNIGSRVYVLHCFQKKSKKGIATTKRDKEMIELRLNQAREIEKGLTDEK